MTVAPYSEPFGQLDQPQTQITPPATAPTGGANAPMPAGGASSDNPFSDVLNHVATWNSALQVQPNSLTAPKASSFDGPDNKTPGGDPLGGNAGGGTTTPPPAAPQAPPGTDPSVWADVNRYVANAAAKGGKWQALLQHPEWVAEFRNWAQKTGLGSAVRIEDYLEAKHPELSGLTGQSGKNTFDSTMQSVDRYAQIAASKGANWQALYAHPEYVTEFRNWSTANDPTHSVRIEDFLEAHHQELKGLAGQSGQNTWDAYMAAHPAGPQAANPPIQAGPYNPNAPVAQPTTPPTAPVITDSYIQPKVTPVDPTKPPVTGGPTGISDPPVGTPPPAGGTPPTTPTPPTGEVVPPQTPQQTPDEIQHLIDIFNQNFGGVNNPDIEKMLDPMFGRQRQLLQQQLESAAALTPGRLQSGGFGQNEGQALSDLSGQQSAQLGGALERQAEAQRQQNTQIMQLATQAGMQKYMADMNNDLERFKVQSNTDLAKWLDTQDNVLKKYGIDTNDVLDRYKAELALKGQEYAADSGVDAAALQAAATESAAAAASAASQSNAQLQYQLGMTGLDVQREQNIGNFVLGLLGLGNVDMNQLNQILAGIPGGTIAVKP